MATRPGSPSSGLDRQRLLVRLLSRNGATLRSQAARHCTSAAEVDDVLQDACVIFLRSFDDPPEAALPWLMVVIRRRAWELAARRRRCEAPFAPSPIDAFDPAEWLERREQLARRIELLAALKPHERTALVLFALGYSYKEIAERQGWTYTKVNRCIYEGRAALRELVSRGVKPSR